MAKENISPVEVILQALDVISICLKEMKLQQDTERKVKVIIHD